MLTKVKKYFFRFPINLLFFVGKLQGLVVFTYETVPGISYKISPFLCAYSSVYSVVIIVALHAFAINIFLGIPIYQSYSKSITVIVYIAEQTITASRVITVYIVQLLHRNTFESLLSEASHLHESIRELTNGVLKFDKTFYHCYFTKVAGILFQLACISYLISLYKRVISTVFYSHIAKFSMFIYMHSAAITISGLFYAGMMFILILYRNLNGKALRISKSLKVVDDTAMNYKIKHRLYRRLGDEIDQILFLYDRISSFSRNFNKLFSLQLLLTVFNAFSVILVELFFMYDNLRQIYSQPELKRFLNGQIVKDLTFVLYYAVELYHGVFISNTVMKQAKESALIFRSTNYHMNIRLKRSIELLSLQSLIESLTVTASGLFEINSTILFGTVATIASYLFILIQFEINDATSFDTKTYFHSFNKRK